MSARAAGKTERRNGRGRERGGEREGTVDRKNRNERRRANGGGGGESLRVTVATYNDPPSHSRTTDGKRAPRSPVARLAR